MIASYALWLKTESALLALGNGEKIDIVRQPPPGGCRIKYYATGSGPVEFVVSGGGVEEIVTFTAPRWYLGTKTFATLSRVQFSGEGTARLEAVNASGNPIMWSTIEGPYAVSIRRIPRDSERIVEAGEARTAHEYYLLATDEDGLSVFPGQKFTISELPGMEFEVWSTMKPIASPLGETILWKEFIARRISP